MSGGADLRVLSGSGPTAGAKVPRPRSRWITRVGVPALIVLATLGVLAYSSRDLFVPAVAVRVSPVVPRPGAGVEGAPGVAESETVVQAPGWIEPAPYAITVPALAEGVVREILVLEGERVEAGQVVARLMDEEARLEAQAAEALVAERRAHAARAEAAVGVAEAVARAERASAEELRDEVERKRGLVDAGALSPGEWSRMQIRLGGLEARAWAAMQMVEEARATLAQAQAALAGALVQRDAAVLRLSRMEIRSPASGVVLARLVGPGVHVSTGSMREGDPGHAGGVLRLYDPASLQARVDVPLADAAKVGVGCRAVVTTEALPDAPIAGVVTRVVHEANIQRNTVQFKVALENPPAALKPEMLVRVRLSASASARPDAASTGSAQAVLLIPERAVTPTSPGHGVAWVVQAASRGWVARRREVTFVPWSEPEFVAVTSGVGMTERVIVEAPAGLADGVRVRVVGEGVGHPADRPQVRGSGGS
jgi:multidrug efflux pump subunit AcrA (membrane-fusion protein)